MEDKCVICGDIIPEGRQVCPKCENKVVDTLYKEKQTEIKAEQDICE